MDEKSRDLRIDMDDAPWQPDEAASARSVPNGNLADALFYMNEHSVRKRQSVDADIPPKTPQKRHISPTAVLWGLHLKGSEAARHKAAGAGGALFTPHTYPAALLLMMLSKLCWGSWANTQNIDKTWRFELFYLDYTFGLLAAAMLSCE
jgi:hypothetical protein